MLFDGVGVGGFGVELPGVAPQVEHTRASLAARRGDSTASESLSVAPSDFVVSSSDAAPPVISESAARPATVIDAETNEGLPVADDRLSFRLSKHDVRVCKVVPR